MSQCLKTREVNEMRSKATWRKIHTIQLDLKFFDVGCAVEYLCSLLEAAVIPDVHRQALELLEDECCGI
jgi:hypothetical protein